MTEIQKREAGLPLLLSLSLYILLEYLYPLSLDPSRALTKLRLEVRQANKAKEEGLNKHPNLVVVVVLDLFIDEETRMDALEPLTKDYRSCL